MKKTLIATALVTAGFAAQAQISGDVIKIGFLTDMSSVYADIDGAGGVEAIKMAIADLKGVTAGKKVELIFADHQNKADVASAKAREWIDTQGLDLLIGGTNSGANLAMATVAAEKKKPFISIGAGSSALTNANCTPYTIHYAYDTVALANGTGAAVTKSGGNQFHGEAHYFLFGNKLSAGPVQRLLLDPLDDRQIAIDDEVEDGVQHIIDAMGQSVRHRFQRMTQLDMPACRTMADTDDMAVANEDRGLAIGDRLLLDMGGAGDDDGVAEIFPAAARDVSRSSSSRRRRGRAPPRRPDLLPRLLGRGRGRAPRRAARARPRPSGRRCRASRTATR